ncbi:MAG: phytanoyl-CoA dioxygenase family protein [Pseudomonadota bacterium]
MTLSTEQRRFYDENGYLVIENLIDAATLTRLRDVIAEFKERSKQIAASDEIYDLGPDHSASTPKLRRLKDPVRRHDAFDALMRSETILDMVAPLLGGSVRFDHSKLNFKPAGGSAKIEWHQDWAFYPHTNDDLLAVGVMVEDCTPENGPLMVIPGSHKGTLYDHHLNGVFAGGIRPGALGSELDRAVALTAQAGSISIHHVRTLHASSDNRSERERPLLLYSYAAVDAFPVFERYDLAEYDSRIVRGSPTLSPRVEPVPMRLPEPRPQAADSIFDNQAALLAS